MQAIPRLIRWILHIAVFFLLTMTILRIFTWWYFKPSDLSLSASLSSFWLGFRYDARSVAILSLLLLLTGSIRPLHPFHSISGKRLSLTIVFLAVLFVVVMYVFDFLHFKYLLQRLNASALSFLEDASISGSMVWQTYPVIRILLGMLAGIALLFFLARRKFQSIDSRPFHGGRKAAALWFIAVFLLAALGIFGRIGQYPLRWSDAFNLNSDFKANLALNPIQSFFSSLSFRASGFDEKKVRSLYPEMAAYLGLPAEPGQHISFKRSVTAIADSNKRPNIVLVICESFSAYKSSMWGNQLNPTPFFDKLSKEGLFFDNCFTPHFGTARGVWATITGIPDVELKKTASRNPGMVDQHTIINDFQGYEKLYFLGGSTSWANIRGLLTNNISNLRLYEEGSYASPAIDVWGISDKNLFLEANAVLKKETAPFFAIIQTADNHRPYTIPEEDLVAFKKQSFPADTLRKYGFESDEELNAFRYTDFGFQTFIEAARKEAYFNNTIFMFIGDHGINGNASAMFPRAWTDQGLSSYHVPLLFYAPGLIAPERLHDVASQVDVLPTLAGLAKINYSNTTLGRDLLKQHAIDSGRSNTAFIIDYNFNNVGVLNGSWYYTAAQQGGKELMVWADFLRSPQVLGDSGLQREYRQRTMAFYETAKYMLLNNKKSK